ncbi:MAG: glycoside hydrolase family 127 protein [Lentisphaerae bacterium]|nr:glycoside hydrolase family 127 protein [Lentisphaerota bacterium]
MTQRECAEVLAPVFPSSLRMNGSFWEGHLKKFVCSWIPHCIDIVEKPRWLGNFVLAAGKLQGLEHGTYGEGHWEAPEMFGYSDMVVHNILEAMCWACTIDAAGDPEMEAAQARFRRTIDEWARIILPAQDKDGVMHTWITVLGPAPGDGFGMHYFFCQALFIEAGIAHYRMTGKKDASLYDAARRCADNMLRIFGVEPKPRVSVPHPAIEYALFLLSTLVEEEEGAGAGKAYEELSKYLCDCRGDGGDTYGQDHLPVTEQADAVGHAVRAVYLYAGMTDVVRTTGDPGYSAAVTRLWDSAVHRRMYLTGGVGASDEREAFDEDYVLPNGYKPAYSETCAACGMVFWQQRLNMAFRDAKYIDVLELSLYNTVLGSVGVDGKTHYYRNPLDDQAMREPWIGACCQGNIARTFASLGHYLYARGDDSLYINLFLGSTAVLDNIAGTCVTVEQRTEYPWDGEVAITLTPAEEKAFTVKIRIPNRRISECYSLEPSLPPFLSLTVNGEDWEGEVVNGYAAISRIWKAGDVIKLVLPMEPQRVTSDPRVAANTGRAALMRGPLVYAFENCDNDDCLEGIVLASATPFTPEHAPGLLNGIVTLKRETGRAVLAIPYFARLNRPGGHAMVWVKG